LGGRLSWIHGDGDSVTCRGGDWLNRGVDA
jgi:hypothetical protein